MASNATEGEAVDSFVVVAGKENKFSFKKTKSSNEIQQIQSNEDVEENGDFEEEEFAMP